MTCWIDNIISLVIWLINWSISIIHQRFHVTKKYFCSIQWMEEILHQELPTANLPVMLIYTRWKSQLRVSLNIIKVNGGKAPKLPDRETEFKIEKDRHRETVRQSLSTHLALSVHMWRQDQEGEVGSCGASPSVMSSRITGVLLPLLGSSVSSERCITITTLDRKARLPVLPQSHQMRKWSDVKKSYSFAEALSADQLIGKARAKTVLLIQITDIDLKTLFIKHGSKKMTKSNFTSFLQYR